MKLVAFLLLPVGLSLALPAPYEVNALSVLQLTRLRQNLIGCIEDRSDLEDCVLDSLQSSSLDLLSPLILSSLADVEQVLRKCRNVFQCADNIISQNVVDSLSQNIQLDARSQVAAIKADRAASSYSNLLKHQISSARKNTQGTARAQFNLVANVIKTMIAYKLLNRPDPCDSSKVKCNW